MPMSPVDGFSDVKNPSDYRVAIRSFVCGCVAANQHFSERSIHWREGCTQNAARAVLQTIWSSLVAFHSPGVFCPSMRAAAKWEMPQECPTYGCRRRRRQSALVEI